MNKLSEADLKAFQDAILKDYGIKLKGKDLYLAAFNLLIFFELLLDYSNNDKEKGSKTVQDNPLNRKK